MIRSWAFGLALLVGCRPTPGATPVAPTVDREAPIRVALTVDDLPTHGAFPPGMTHLQAHEKMLAAFAAHEVPKVYGFVNTGRTIDGQDADAPLRAWLAAGHPLGNHTQAHGRMKEMGVPAYLADIDLNDRVLATLVPDERTRRVFRYPFLYEGSDPYRIAEVTIDFYDWAFNGPYVRCLALGDQNALDALRKTYVQHAIRMLQWSDEAARRVWQRPVPHILLMHVGSFSAEMIEPVLTAYEAENVEWITLDDAMEDPIYADLPVADGVTQGTLIEAMVDARGVDHPPWPEHPEALLGALCPTGA
jgi:peptidoglycan/xylan/chitin deacetylase (PgdA/CDA1 family)